MPGPRVLTVDDDEGIRGTIRDYLQARGYEVREAEDLASAQGAFTVFRPDIVVLDYQLPDGNALDVLPRWRSMEPDVPVVLLTGYGDIELAVSAIKAGAEHFLTKPVQLAALETLLERSLDERRQRRRLEAHESRDARQLIDPFVGVSKAIRALADEARMATWGDSPALLLGETGTGKGVLARWLHTNSRRTDESFVDLNCAGLSRELLESELFGHAKGAFTGAVQTKQGLLEMADRGTVFLDEIGDLDAAIQPKLLTVLEEKRFRRLGELDERRVDIRLVAATNRDLAKSVEEGTFRADLFYRINTLTLRLPSLRDRLEDLPELARVILVRLSTEVGRRAELSAGAIAALERHRWPGNIRELRNVLERALLVSRDEVLPESAIAVLERGPRPPSAASAAADPDGAFVTLEELVRQHIERALTLECGKVVPAADRLGIPRSSLYQKIRELSLDLDRYRA